MPESMTQCPGCGRMFPTNLQVMDDSGNTICPDCAKKAQEKDKEKESK